MPETEQKKTPANAFPINGKAAYRAQYLLNKARWFCKTLERYPRMITAITLMYAKQAEKILESLREFSEAKYYLAYVYSVQNKITEAIELLTSLISTKNAYTAKAADFLCELQVYANRGRDNGFNENDRIALRFKAYCLDPRFGYELMRDFDSLTELQKNYFILKAADAGHPRALIEKIDRIKKFGYGWLNVENLTVITPETTFVEYVTNIKPRDTHKQLTKAEESELWLQTLKQAAKAFVKKINVVLDDVNVDTKQVMTDLYALLGQNEFKKFAKECDQFNPFATIFLGERLIEEGINGKVTEESKMKGMKLLIEAIDLEWKNFQDAINHVEKIISFCGDKNIKVPVDVLQAMLDKSIIKFGSHELATICGILYLDGSLGFVCDSIKAGAYFYKGHKIAPGCLDEFLEDIYLPRNKEALFHEWIKQYQLAKPARTDLADEDSMTTIGDFTPAPPRYMF